MVCGSCGQRWAQRVKVQSSSTAKASAPTASDVKKKEVKVSEERKLLDKHIQFCKTILK